MRAKTRLRSQRKPYMMVIMTARSMPIFPDGVSPSKILAVHLNYRSRAAQRGAVPTHPSYFLKATTTLSTGGPVVRPRGTELLVPEGEIALIIDHDVREVDLAGAAAAIGWVAPANDFGLYDLRWADRGSNVLSKSHDGFTPLGSARRAEELDLDALRLRTTINGE